MSYYACLNFVYLENRSDVFDFVLKFSNNCYENREDYISENIGSSPAYFNMSNEPKMMGEDGYWVLNLFNHTFLYWENLHLLALMGNCYPQECMKDFSTNVEFQNSTDQDYDYNDWNGIALFENIVKEVQGYSIDEIKNNLLDYEVDDDVEYWRQTLVYKKIYELLELDNLFYSMNVDNCPYIRFSINGLDDRKKTLNAHKTFRICLRNQIQEDELWFQSLKNNKE